MVILHFASAKDHGKGAGQVQVVAFNHLQRPGCDSKKAKEREPAIRRLPIRQRGEGADIFGDLLAASNLLGLSQICKSLVHLTREQGKQDELLEALR